MSEAESYKLSIPDGASWIRIEIRDSISAEVGRTMLIETVELANIHDIHGILLDVLGAPSVKSVVDQYQLVNNELEKFGFDRFARIAILVRDQDSSRTFLETTLRNAGYKCSLFTERNFAEDWLKRPPTQRN